MKVIGERLGIPWNREGEASTKGCRGTGQDPVEEHGRRKRIEQRSELGLKRESDFWVENWGNEEGKICLDTKKTKCWGLGFKGNISMLTILPFCFGFRNCNV